jgi:hypothetical protein
VACCPRWEGFFDVDAHFTATRARAYELADSGAWATWSDIARELRREGFEEHDIKRLEHDSLTQLMLRRRIERAVDGRAAASASARDGDFAHAAVRDTWWEWEASGDVHEPILVVETTLLLKGAAAAHVDAYALQALVGAARVHFEQLGYAVDRVRLVPTID